MRALAVLGLAASVAAQSRPIELIPAPAPKSWVVSHLLAKPQVTYPDGALLQLRNPAVGRGSYATVTTEKIPIAAKLGDEPNARLSIRVTMSAKLPNGRDACWWEVKDAATGARLGIYRGQTYDQVVSFASPIPDQGNLPPIKEVVVLIHPRLSPLAIWRVEKIEAWRTHGPSIRLIANPNMLDVDFERSNYGSWAYGVIASFTRLPNRVLIPGMKGPGLLLQPDLIVQVPLAPIISHDTALIGMLRRLHWQAIELAPQPALGWSVDGR